MISNVRHGLAKVIDEKIIFMTTFHLASGKKKYLNVNYFPLLASPNPKINNILTMNK